LVWSLLKGLVADDFTTEQPFLYPWKFGRLLNASQMQINGKNVRGRSEHTSIGKVRSKSGARACRMGINGHLTPVAEMVRAAAKKNPAPGGAGLDGSGKREAAT
jgi:hypothetical protein